MVFFCVMWTLFKKAAMKIIYAGERLWRISFLEVMHLTHSKKPQIYHTYINMPVTTLFPAASYFQFV